MAKSELKKYQFRSAFVTKGITNNFYPQGNYMSYSYLSSLQSVKSELGKSAYSRAVEQLGKSNSKLVMRQSSQDQKFELNELDILKTYCEIASNNEKKFLAKFNLSDKDSSNSWKKLIEAYNSLLSNQTILKHKINELQKIRDRINKTYTDPSGELDTYFQQSLAESFTSNAITNVNQINEQWILQNIASALMTAYSKVDKDDNLDQEVQVYKEFLEMFEKLDLENPIFRDIYHVYNGSKGALVKLENELRSLFNENGRKKETTNESGRKLINDLTSTKENVSLKFGGKSETRRGDLLEVIESLTVSKIANVLKEDENLQVKAVPTGSSGQKGDTVILLESLNVTDDGRIMDTLLGSRQSESDSVRVQNHERMQELYKKMEEERTKITDAYDSIVFISDKNYIIKNITGSGGFAAQSGVKLTNLQELFTVNYSSKVEDLIYVLSNSGADLINGNNYSNALDYIATQIAYFLFDNVDISFSNTDITSVHLFNLGGIYIPLSVLLEGAYQALYNTFAISKAQTSYSRMIKIHFTPAEALEEEAGYDHDGPLTQKDWTDFHNNILTHSTISVHFLKNFASFITDILNNQIASL